VREQPELFKNGCLSANTMAKGGTDLAENKRCDLQEGSKNAVVPSAATDDSTNNLISQRPNFAHGNAHNRTPPEVHVIYLGNKEILCVIRHAE